MAGKKDKTIVAVISDLTTTQAAQITKDILKAKQKYAPTGRGTIATGKKEHVAGLIQKAHRKRVSVNK